MLTEKQWQMRILALEVSDAVIARLAGVLIPTVSAWKTGEIQPHRSVREAMINVLENETKCHHSAEGEAKDCLMAPCCNRFEE